MHGVAQQGAVDYQKWRPGTSTDSNVFFIKLWFLDESLCIAEWTLIVTIYQINLE